MYFKYIMEKTMNSEINITTRKQLEIYMNPQRQRLLKCMDIKGEPLTPKHLSDLLGISSSSVTHHLKKLEEIGLVTLDHTESIHGICAKFYRRVPAIVNLKGDSQDDLKSEKELLADYLMMDTWNGFKQYMKNSDKTSDSTEPRGDAINGILYLTKEEAEQVKHLISEFQSKHLQPQENTVPWEVALIAYPTEK